MEEWLKERVQNWEASFMILLPFGEKFPKVKKNKKLFPTFSLVYSELLRQLFLPFLEN
jgi:hypothetical protein